MTGEELLPPAFLRAMEAELAAQHEAMRASADSRIGEMIAACRDEAAAAVKKRAALCEEALERLSTRRRRLMRAVESAAQKEVEAQHLRQLEQELRRKVELFRSSESYGTFLTRMVEQCRRAGFSSAGTFQAAEREAGLLRAAGLCVEEKDPGRWGGFILTEEGGALFDCTFQTRWEQYCCERVIRSRGRS